jgi:hypothetical protein
MKCRWGEDQKVPLAGGESDSFSGSKKKGQQAIRTPDSRPEGACNDFLDYFRGMERTL